MRGVCVLLLQDLLQSCSHGGGRRVEDMCYERRRASVWMSLLITGTSEEPGALTQGAPVFPGSSRLGIEPKTPGWLVQDPTTRPIGDLIPTIGGSGANPWRGWDRRRNRASALLFTTASLSFFASNLKTNLQISKKNLKVSYHSHRNFSYSQTSKNLLRKWSCFCKNIL